MILGIGIRPNKTVFIQPGKRPDGHGYIEEDYSRVNEIFGNRKYDNGSKHIFKISYDKEK